MQKTLKTLLAASTFLLAACANTAVKYSEDNMAGIAQDLLKVDPLPEGFESEALTLEKSREMAITRNRAYRQRVNRLMVQLSTEQKNSKSMLPEIYASSFGRWRNNTNASVGVRVEELGTASPEDFYTAQDQSFANSNLTLTWNMLDLALMGQNKSGASIKAYDAIEDHRLGCHQLMVDVERAFWRKAAYDRANEKRNWLNDRIEYGLTLSSQEAEKSEDKELSEWMYQRELIDIKRWYESMYRGLASAESDLKKLLNISHRTEFTVDTAHPHTGGEFGSSSEQDLLEPDQLNQDIDALFLFALKNRPELRRARYSFDQMEVNNKTDLLRRLPGLSLFLSANNDTNSFALNKDFISAGVNLSWDVMSLVNIGDVKRQGEARLSLEAEEMEVIATTILAQVALAKEELKNINVEVDLAWKAKDIQSGITDKLDEDVRTGENREIYLIKEELLREMSILREDIARAELQASKARLAQSLGMMKSCEI